MLLALSNGSTKNRAAIVMGIIGGAIPDIILVTLVSFGLGALLNASNTLFLIIKTLGVLYLLWLAIQLWQTKTMQTSLSGPACSLSPKTAFIRSFLAALFNPKAILFFSAFLPQFIVVNQPKLLQYAAFVSINVILNILMMSLYAITGFYATKWLTSKNVIRLNRICAIVLASLAVLLLTYRCGL